MAPRKAQENPERRTAILDAAMKVFAEKGYRGATSRVIATAAGITPGTIYWYFKGKEDLFRAVIRERSPVPAVLAQAAQSDRPPEEVIPEIMDTYLRALEETPAKYAFRIILSEVGHDPGIAAVLRDEVALRLLGALVEYVTTQMDKGRIRRINPAFVPMAIMGPLLMVLLGQSLLGMDFGPQAREIAVNSLSDVILRGLLPREEGASAPGSAPGPKRSTSSKASGKGR
ncbi:MAG: TetR/AcrR family transcriptional regulator [Bacillota bacterium]